MSSPKGKGFGLFGMLGLIALVVGAIGTLVYTLQTFDLVDILPKDESIVSKLVMLVLVAPTAAVVFGFLGSKGADTGSRKGKCFGVMAGGIAILVYVAWLVFIRPAD